MARWIPLRRIALVAFVLVLVTGACAGGEDDASAGDAGAFGTAADEADMGEPTPPTDASEDGGSSDADPGDRRVLARRRQFLGGQVAAGRAEQAVRGQHEQTGVTAHCSTSFPGLQHAAGTPAS